MLTDGDRIGIFSDRTSVAAMGGRQEMATGTLRAFDIADVDRGLKEERTIRLVAGQVLHAITATVKNKKAVAPWAVVSGEARGSRVISALSMIYCCLPLAGQPSGRNGSGPVSPVR